ncbi:hypothetical protein BD0114_03130 [Helicobacter pylori]
MVVVFVLFLVVCIVINDKKEKFKKKERVLGYLKGVGGVLKNPPPPERPETKKAGNKKR